MRDDIVVWVDDATGAGLIEGLGGRFLVLFGVERKPASGSGDRLCVFGEGARQVGFFPGTGCAFVDGFDAIDEFRGILNSAPVDDTAAFSGALNMKPRVVGV